jgi:hypothetical protein
MSNRTHIKRTRAGIAAAMCFAFLAVPVAAQADHVDLGTADPFVVLGGSAVTNTGSSVLNGDLGVWQAGGGDLTGFLTVDGGPGIVNGAVHDDDLVAQQAQSDLTTAYNTAAGEPSDFNLTGQDLGLVGTLTPGVYTFSSSAQLTGALTLDAGGDPDAQFIFQIGTTLTTAPSSSVVLAPGTSPCNIYWQVGSSATLDTDTQFLGNLLANDSISMASGTTVAGRALARVGAVTLINNVFDVSTCEATSSDDGDSGGSGDAPTDTTLPVGSDDGSSDGSDDGSVDEGVAPTPTRRLRPRRTRDGRARIRRAPRRVPASVERCTLGFRAAVRGRMIRRVVFRLDGRRVATRRGSPFRVFLPAVPGAHKVTARVSFTDATRARTLTMRYRACAAAVLQPRRGPSRFTG